VAELQKFELEHVIPMHCSGQTFIDLVHKEMRKSWWCAAPAAASHLLLELGYRRGNGRSFTLLLLPVSRA
jgi:hypothetical protein